MQDLDNLLLLYTLQVALESLERIRIKAIVEALNVGWRCKEELKKCGAGFIWRARLDNA